MCAVSVCMSTPSLGEHASAEWLNDECQFLCQLCSVKLASSADAMCWFEAFCTY